MSFPQNLPKPPPKGPPPRLPGAAPAPSQALPAPSASHASPPAHPPAIRSPLPPSGAPARPQPAAAGPSAAHPQIFVQARPAAPSGIVVPGLPPNLALMIEAVQIYDALLVEENAMLRDGNSKEVAGLLDRKIAATHLYQERLRAVLGDSATTRQLTPDQRQKVVTLVKVMEDRARENTLLLKANMSAIEQVIEAVNTASRKMRKREVAYSGAGKIRETYSPVGVSMAFNHTI